MKEADHLNPKANLDWRKRPINGKRTALFIHFFSISKLKNHERIIHSQR